MQVDLGDLLSSAQAALQGAAGAVLTPSLPELASRLEQPPQAASSAAYYDSFVAGELSLSQGCTTGRKLLGIRDTTAEHRTLMCTMCCGTPLFIGSYHEGMPLLSSLHPVVCRPGTQL